MRKISSLTRSVAAMLMKHRVASGVAGVAVVLAAIGPHMSFS